MVNMWAMAPRGQIELVVSFGPTSSPLFRRAAAYAARHASTWAELSPGTWRASFVLGQDPEPYGRAWRLLRLVGAWRATEVEVEGSPEPLAPVEAMVSCARAWLRRVGACRASFPSGPWPKCECCPLYDAGWAAESFSPPTFFSGEIFPFEGPVAPP
jgi:hypothetical protein